MVKNFIDVYGVFGKLNLFFFDLVVLMLVIDLNFFLYDDCVYLLVNEVMV